MLFTLYAQIYVSVSVHVGVLCMRNKTKQHVYCIFADTQIHQMTDVGGIHTNKTIFPAEISA